MFKILSDFGKGLPVIIVTDSNDRSEDLLSALPCDISGMRVIVLKYSTAIDMLDIFSEAQRFYGELCGLALRKAVFIGIGGGGALVLGLAAMYRDFPRKILFIECGGPKASFEIHRGLSSLIPYAHLVHCPCMALTFKDTPRASKKFSKILAQALPVCWINEMDLKIQDINLQSELQNALSFFLAQRSKASQKGGKMPGAANLR
ncbi:MAG: hypothetical protein D6808_06000 [Candidatus Dadabacteria bacterium]|nr:MAG: hypothetical protein D6808_06000 [Candidatus Dadabacteria bacterium]